MLRLNSCHSNCLKQEVSLIMQCFRNLEYVDIRTDTIVRDLNLNTVNYVFINSLRVILYIFLVHLPFDNLSPEVRCGIFHL